MQENLTYGDIKQLLAEADALLGQIDSEIKEYLEEGQRIELEQRTQKLQELRSEVQDKVAKGGSTEPVSYSEGAHEAIDEITRAMKSLADYLS
jgi:hypothetical protein